MAPIPLPPLRIKLRSQGQKSPKNEIPKRKHWRQIMKEDQPEQYEMVKAKDAQYTRLKNVSMTEEKKQRQRELTKERMRKYRQRKKEEAKTVVSKSRTPKQLKEEEKKKSTQRQKWAQQKQEQRAKWTQEKRNETNLKLRMKRRQDKQELQDLREKIIKEERKKVEEDRKKLEEEQKSIEEEKQKLEEDRQKFQEEQRKDEERKRCVAETEQLLQKDVEDLAQERSALAALKKTSGQRSKISKRKALSRARMMISPQSSIYAETISDLVEHCTPRKKNALKQLGVIRSKSDVPSIVSERIAQELKINKHKRDKPTRNRRRGLATSLLSVKSHKSVRAYGVTPKLLKNLNKNDRYKSPFSMSASVKKQVKSYFEKNAQQLPNKKDVGKKNMQKKKVLQRPITAIYKDFKRDQPNVKIRKSSFFMLRPKHVKLMSQNKMRGCLCEYCTNLSLKLKVLNSVSARFKLAKCHIRDVYQASELSMCCKSDEAKYHQPACIKRECSSCGVRQVGAFLQPVILEAGEDHKTQWSRWGVVKDGTTSKMKLQTKEGNLRDLLAELHQELEAFPQHLFDWMWQHGMYTLLAENPPNKTVIAVLDFAENYTCLIQDEVQAGHWNHEQATLHPIVCTYRCRCHDEPVTHSLVYVSNDRKHDYHAVHEFYSHCINHLKTVHKIPIKKVHRFSDGCAAQYKSKGPFLDIAEYQTPTEHHFYGSRHGKGPSDGESAVVKHNASMAVSSSRATITTPQEFYTNAKQNLTKNEEKCMPFRREVFYIPSNQINRKRPVPLKPLRGTRSIHSIKMGKEKHSVLWKRLSCFCDACLTNGECTNAKYTGTWKKAQLELPDASAAEGPPKPAAKDKTGRNSPSEDVPVQEQGSKERVPSSASVDDFVSVRVPVKGSKRNRSESFIAKIITVEDEQHVRLQYMEKQGNMFKWPGGETQYFLHPRSDIERVLPSPEPVLIGTRILFKFIEN